MGEDREEERHWQSDERNEKTRKRVGISSYSGKYIKKNVLYKRKAFGG